MKDLDLEVKSGRGGAHDVDKLKSEIVGLSIRYQVLSDYTAFLAVIQEAAEDSNGERVKVLIPNVNPVR